MSVLSDGTIRRLVTDEQLGIDPYDPKLLQPASYDVRLAADFRVYRKTYLPPEDIIDLDDVRDCTVPVPPEHTRWNWSKQKFERLNGYLLVPGGFVLARTVERVRMPDNILARVEGKSSIARLGLAVHITAGFIDPGFEGTITLEIANLNPTHPILLRPGRPIAQLNFSFLDYAAERPYGHEALGSKYQGQTDTTGSRYQG